MIDGRIPVEEIDREKARGEMYTHLLANAGWQVLGPFPSEADEDGVEVYMVRSDPADGYRHEALEERIGAFATVSYQYPGMTYFGGRADTYMVGVVDRNWEGRAPWRVIVDSCDVIYSTHFPNIGQFGHAVMDVLVEYGNELVQPQ